MKLLKRLLVDHWGRRDDDFNWRKDQRPLDADSVDSVVVLHLNGKLGDAVIDSLLVDALARACPRLAVSVGTTAAYEAYWRAHPHVQDVVVMPPSKGRSSLGRVPAARRAGRAVEGRFDVVVSLESFAQPDHFALIRAMKAKTVVGFNKNRFRLFDYSLDEGRHGVEARSIFGKIASVMRVFGEEVVLNDLRFHLPFGPKDERRAQAIAESSKSEGPRLMLHTYGTGGSRLLSPETVVQALKTLRRAGHQGPVWVSVAEGRQADYETAMCQAELGEATVIGPMESIFSLFALVARMDLVVAPDTSVGHIAAALGKPQICIFPDTPNVPRVWRPRNERCVVVIAERADTVDALDWNAFEAAGKRVLAWAQDRTEG